MRRSARQGVVLATALLVVTGALAAPAATAAPVPAPTPSSATVHHDSSPPTAGPTERLCAPATPGHATCFAERRVGVQPAAAGTPPDGYGPADLVSAYGLPTTGGAGVTIGVVDAYDYPTAAADLATYRAQFGLPALADGQVRTVNQDGATSPLPRYDSGWAGESALDLDMITATCPSCSIVFVEANTDATDDLAAAAATAVRLGATYVSNSYGSADNVGPNGDAGYSAAGVSYFAATGDEGYSTDEPESPATIPGVVAVGGTSLRPATNSRGWAETAWKGAGHGTGCSVVYPRPDFQAGVDTGCAGRAVADVSADADPLTGVAVYDSSPNGGGWTQVGGTSAATPIVTGIAALAGHPGLPTADLYTNAADFHDVTSGATGSCGTVQCTAGPGWDAPTGLGTPAGVSGFAPPTATTTSCGGTPSAPDAGPLTSAGQYVPITPTRVLDTRSDPQYPTLGPGGSVTLDLSSKIPSASAVVVNVTATNPTAAGFVTVWPAGASRPTASTLNTSPGVTRANEATVALGPVPGSGEATSGISLYNSVGTTDLVVDLLGYYTAAGDTSSAGLTYHPAANPVRALDTRYTAGGPLTASGTGSKACVTVSQPATAGGPAITGIGAVAVTLTAVDPTGDGYLKAWNGDDAHEPLVSTLNFRTGQIVPNATVVPVNCLDTACSQVTFAVANRISPSTDVVVDVVGVYSVDANGGLVLQPQSPQRIVDTRVPQGFGTLGQGATGQVNVPGAVAGGAVAANVTAVLPTVPTYLTAFGATRPGTSNLNPVPGDIVPAAVTTSVDANGDLSVYNNSGSVDVVVDVAGVFVPPTT